MNKIGIELKWAAFITAFACLWAALENALGYHKDFSNILITSFIYYVILTFLWAIAFIDKKKSLGKNAVWEFKSVFKFGLFLTGITALLSPIAQYIIYETISPDYFTNIIEYQLKKGRETIEILQQRYNMNFVISLGVRDALSFGVIYSALYAWVFKTKKESVVVPVTNSKKKK